MPKNYREIELFLAHTSCRLGHFGLYYLREEN